ncbi:MAG TPA: radical SAM protein [Anaeromyxobacter sp.]
MPGLLDVILGYDCNLACDYCTCVGSPPGRALPSGRVLEALRDGRRDGFDAASFTGGEPTLRRDLVALVRAARGLGYAEVKLQTNGLVLAHRPNVARLLDAGVTLVHLSVHTHLADAYDRMVRRPGAHALMAQALANLVESGVPLRADLVVTASTYPRLEAAIRWLAALGVRRVDLWWVSLTDANRENVASLPRVADAAADLAEALAAARELGVEARSLHVPRCLLGPDAGHAWDPGSSRVRVVSPEATFDLADSRLAGRVHVPACEGCPHREICPGIRPDYLAHFGEGEFVRARAAQAVQGGSGASGSS